MEGDFVFAVRADLFEVAIPGFARIDAELVARPFEQEVPGALDVLGRKRLAVMPFDALAQRQGQRSPFLVPRPAGRQIGHDRFKAALLHVLVEHDEIVEHSHRRPLGKRVHAIEHRHARRVVPDVHFENAARFLGECRPSARGRNQQRTRRGKRANVFLHFRFPPFAFARRPSLLCWISGVTRPNPAAPGPFVELSFTMPTLGSLPR